MITPDLFTNPHGCEVVLVDRLGARRKVLGLCGNPAVALVVTPAPEDHPAAAAGQWTDAMVARGSTRRACAQDLLRLTQAGSWIHAGALRPAHVVPS